MITLNQKETFSVAGGQTALPTTQDLADAMAVQFSPLYAAAISNSTNLALEVARLNKELAETQRNLGICKEKVSIAMCVLSPQQETPAVLHN